MNLTYLSPSQIALFKQCGLAYKYKYIDKIPPTYPSIAVVKGAAVHSIIQGRLWNRSAKIESLIEAFIQSGDVDYNSLTTEDKDAVVKSIRKAIPLLESNVWLPPEGEDIVSAESVQEFKIDIGNDSIPIVVRPDLYTTNAVYDHKVVQPNSVFRYERVKYPLQLIIEAMATGKNTAVYNLFIETTDEFLFKRIYFHNINLRFKRAVEEIKKVYYMIRNNMFYPVDKDSETGWKCSSKFCDYFELCRFGKEEAEVLEQGVGF